MTTPQVNESSNAKSSMNPKSKSFKVLFCLLTATMILPVLALVDDALSFAYEAAYPYVQEGYTIREEAWAGDLGVDESKAVTAQLFRGNDYWFFLATDQERAKISVHVYDDKGNLAEVESWQRGKFAASQVKPKRSGTYYIIVKVQRSPSERTHWGLVYGFK